MREGGRGGTMHCWRSSTLSEILSEILDCKTLARITQMNQLLILCSRVSISQLGSSFSLITFRISIVRV